MTPRHSERDRWPGLSAARDEAARRGARSVGTQHVLFALLESTDSRAAAALRAGGVIHESAAAALDAVEGVGAWLDSVSVESVRISSRVERILETARAIGSDDDDVIRDADVLHALLTSDDPAVGQLVVAIVSDPQRVLDTLTASAGSAADTGRDV